MIGFYDAATSFPTALLTVLLAAVLGYWLLAIVGLVEFDDGGLSLDMDVEMDGVELGAVASYLVAFGLSGVPISVVVTLIVLLAWTLCCLAAMWLLPLLPGSVPGALGGIAALVVSLAAALPVTAAVLRPMRGLFVTHAARSNASLIGESCKILTRSVDAGFGRAEVSTRGASLNIKVWAQAPNALRRGSVARILDYDAASGRYQVVPEDVIGAEK